MSFSTRGREKMRANPFIPVAVACALALSAFTPVVNGAIIIDDFQNNGTTFSAVVDSGGYYGFLQTNLPGIINGKRHLDIYLQQFDVSGFDSVQINDYSDAVRSFLDINNSSGAQETMELDYGSPLDNILGLPHTADANTVELKFLEYDRPLFEALGIHISAIHGTSPTAQAVNLPVITLVNNGAQTIDVSLAPYWAKGYSTLDGLGFTFGAGRAADYRIDSITLVPEPSFAALATAGMFLSIRRTRSSRNS